MAGQTPTNPIGIPMVLLLGAGGSGKGTLGLRIQAKYHFKHVSVGALIRGEVKDQSDVGKEIQKRIQEKQSTHDLIMALVGTQLQDAVDKKRKGAVIDGHWTTELGAAFESTFGAPRLVFYLQADEPVLLSRITERSKSSGRPEDNLASAKKRLDYFKTWAPSSLEAYTNRSKLVRLNANQPIDDVLDELSPSIEDMLAGR